MTFTTTFGAAQVDQVTELDRWAFPPAGLFPAIPDGLAEATLADLGPGYIDPDTGDLLLAIHTYLIRLGETTIVVDTGNGNAKERPALLPHHMFDTDYLDRLAATGIAPDDVDLVISTHLHPDHCGWNTRLVDGQWRPTFPNAVYLFAREDLIALQSLAAGDGLDGVMADLARTYVDSVGPVLREGHWRAVDDGEVIAADDHTEVIVRASPGHTDGHLAVEIRTSEGGAIVAGDAIHHPIQLLHPDLVQGGDADPETARATREQLLRRCADEGLLLLPAHFTEHAPFRVTIDAGDRPVVSAVSA
ncbi:MBL fold metallo-hydrolase [Tsukamurella pulmonis]|uniref:MBL fold metallo-hydrolase n=1 Tax=Tsukamurella pulmonis TaxID=47312 RepID=UPI000797234E|nr:MBL fold metallo-hydrolase [Tsukamurella pulmonis]KXP13222.1 MBL fold metallo-hydrolase [Tsukamurella pulmonis]RDH10729.1 MBL fold metallo-hydrolase [Tsukamurella pulmonis]